MAPDRTGWVRGLTRRSFHRIAFMDWGPASAVRPVRCVHGLTRNGRDFDHLAAVLAAAGRRVVCPDLPGRGAKRTAAETAAIMYCPNIAADMTVLMAALGDATEVDWIGTSLRWSLIRDGSGGTSGQSDPPHRHQRYRALSALGRLVAPRRKISTMRQSRSGDDRASRRLLPAGSGLALNGQFGGCALAASDDTQYRLERGGTLLPVALRPEHCPRLSKPLALQRRPLEILGCNRRAHSGRTQATIGFAL